MKMPKLRLAGFGTPEGPVPFQQRKIPWTRTLYQLVSFRAWTRHDWWDKDGGGTVRGEALIDGGKVEIVASYRWDEDLKPEVAIIPPHGEAMVAIEWPDFDGTRQ